MNWDPLQELVALHERARRPSARDTAAWTPNVDLVETSSAYLIVVELPGLGSNDFSLEAAGDELVVSGQRPAPNPAPERYLRLERGHGRFSRSFAFGEPVDVARIAAAFDRGLLSITVPKAAGTADRRITIR